MEDIIKLHDKKFRIMIPAAKIDEAVAAVACRINEDYRDKPTPLFVGVLNGSFMFMSDLIKKIEFQNELSFVKLASYDGTCSTGCVKSLIGLNNSIEGRHVIIVEDIVDTGESIEHMIKELEARNPASVEVCTLFFKPDSYRKQLPIPHCSTADACCRWSRISTPFRARDSTPGNPPISSVSAGATWVAAGATPSIRGTRNSIRRPMCRP